VKKSNLAAIYIFPIVFSASHLGFYVFFNGERLIKITSLPLLFLSLPFHALTLKPTYSVPTFAGAMVLFFKSYRAHQSNSPLWPHYFASGASG
jgi:hypothetical protein